MNPPPANRSDACQSSTPTPTPPTTTQLHQDDMDEEDESVKQLDECSSLYLAMQDCIVNSNRNWKECQKEVQALKECNQRKHSKVK